MSTEPSTDDQSQTQFEDHPRLQRSTFSPGTIMAGRYRVERLIGEGGMGDVYLATHLLIDKPVAVKVLAPEQMRRARTVSRFLQEAKAASKIRHPNVVDITDYGESDGCAFFVMEYLEGEDLDRLLKREGRIPWERARHILVQLLEALSAAHKAGIVHRDIKPHNCFITPTPHNRDFVKVIDFGIAKLRTDESGEALTRTGAIMGTAEYMSPEQGLGEEIDGRSDLYSVGVILYRMLTGKVPFAGANPMGILYQHIHAEVVPPSRAAPDAGIGADVDALVLRAMSKQRDERFPTAEAFIEALQNVDDVSAGTVTPPRSKRGLYGVALLGIGLLGLGAALAWPREDASSPTVAVTTPDASDDPPRATPDPPPSPGDRHIPEPSDAPEVDPSPDPSAAPVDDAADPGTAADDSAAAAEPPEMESTADDPASVDTPAQAHQPPVRRTARAIRSSLSKVADKVSACGKKAGLFPGEKVAVEVEIGTDGKVTTAQVKGTFSRAGASCIENALRRAKFGPAAKPEKHDHVFEI